MSEKQGSKRERLDGYSWGLWAERAVVRALEIPPTEAIEGALLHGQPTSHVALLVARSIGFLAGTQQSPELPEGLRLWLNSVAEGDRPARGLRLGGLSWVAWARRASALALNIAPDKAIEGPLLSGQPLWKLAVTIARTVGYLSGAERAPELALGLRTWLQGSPRLPGRPPSEEQAE